MRYRVALIFAALMLGPSLHAQAYFGKNQVQYDAFDWKVIETEHFLVHYFGCSRGATGAPHGA